MKQIALLLSLSLFTLTSLCAQEIVPLGGYDFLNVKPKGQPAGQAKMNCDNLLPDGFLQVTAEDSLDITINVDTNGFEVGSAYTCLNCDDLEFGELESTDAGFTYTANADVEQGLDTLELAFCNPDGDDCSVVQTVIVVAQRASRTFTFSAETLSPQERIDIEVPLDELPEGVACRFFADCEDGYLGNEQSVYFLRDIMVNNDFAYVAARYGGVDQVCLQVCNDLALCDEYIYEFEVVRPNIDLPFFDDFSNEGNRPRLELWQNQDVLVNRTLAVLPPSIGVATFDGIGPRGFAYPLDGTVTGPRDFLTSAPINMGGESNLAITFYAQLRGLGDRPEINDSLRLEFLRQDGEWQNVWSTRGISTGFGNCVDTAFTFYQVDIGNQFYYDGFQFRFSNLSSQTGAVDTWHLDYVKVEGANQMGLNDIAFVAPPPSILAEYTALPYRQLLAAGQGILRTSFEASFWNHALPAQTIPISAADYRIEELGTMEVLLEPNGFDIGSLAPGLTAFTNNEPDDGLFNDYLEALEDFDEDGEYVVATTYDLGGVTFTEETDPGFVESVNANNFTTTTTVFADAYAYDDGSSELALAAQSGGQTIVQRYEAFTDEVLRGVSIRLPRSVNDVSNLTIDLVVFLGDLEDGGSPDLSMTVSPIYAEAFYSDSLEGFTSYAFPDSLDIPQGDFYVGWRQNGTCSGSTCVPVGMDRNNNVEGVRFFRNSGDWNPLEGCSLGALMIRPLVGNSQVPVTSTTEFNRDEFVTVYPNPANERVFLTTRNDIELTRLNWTLYSLTGSQLARGTADSQGIDLSNYAAGTYFLRVVDSTNGKISRHKLVVQ
ncbi:hypothetical protein CEQ90_09510 [Lewinellaceae bacterium SD302]|nr:hypothetical protein CEQ90_09510 [Lewinellaceae bacterium SD302]